MIQILKRIFGIGSKVDMGELIAKGAIIIDVRSKEEYAGGHLKNSVNIPLNSLSGNIKNAKSKDQPIITCCVSGMRSSNAKHFLKEQGYTNVHNGGNWVSLKKYEK
jgi:phage shock protein E